jgi:tetraacyldisaccharide-1-P 4'-kinase
VPLVRWNFGDHHLYKPSEIRELAKEARRFGAEALITTEKDVMNLGERARENLSSLRLYWLKIVIEVDREELLLQRIGALVGKSASHQR